MATMHASLVTPERLVYEAEVQAVLLRTDFGEAAFLPGHTPLIGALVPGVVRFQREDGTEEKAAVHGGFVQVDGEHVVVLAPMAELAEEIDVERARRAAEAAGAGGSGSGSGSGSAGHAEEGADAAHDDALARARLRIEVAGA
jgi:F-type H+-transporting ATPase subunit epsilon